MEGKTHFDYRVLLKDCDSNTVNLLRNVIGVFLPYKNGVVADLMTDMQGCGTYRLNLGVELPRISQLSRENAVLVNLDAEALLTLWGSRFREGMISALYRFKFLSESGTENALPLGAEDIMRMAGALPSQEMAEYFAHILLRNHPLKADVRNRLLANPERYPYSRSLAEKLADNR